VRTFLLTTVTVFVAIIAIAALIFGGSRAVSDFRSDQRQQVLDPFYATPVPMPTNPGHIVRIESLDLPDGALKGGTGSRMLYVSERPDGTPAVSGGMIFVPDNVQPGAPIVAWAHGTVGLGDACAPSRAKNPLQDTKNWLNSMMERGWVVAATDYVGLGTEGPSLYLIAQAEVRDVVNAVRAARTHTSAGSEFVVWGHSQGGHSSLWSGHLAEALAPELTLLGVAAAAPAAELRLIVQAQWQVPAWGWALGPEILQSWPVKYPGLDVTGVVTPNGIADAPRVAQECIVLAALEGAVRGSRGDTFFAKDPMARDEWRAVAEEQSVPPMPPEIPVFIGQSTADTVVLPWPNAVLQNRWCAAGSTLETVWIGDVAHQNTAMVIGPQVVRWIEARFAGISATTTCDEPAPVAIPASADS
jgi:alpha-beta hydrolase superfamily lysophospholipase